MPIGSHGDVVAGSSVEEPWNVAILGVLAMTSTYATSADVTGNVIVITADDVTRPAGHLTPPHLGWEAWPSRSRGDVTH